VLTTIGEMMPKLKKKTAKPVDAAPKPLPVEAPIEEPVGALPAPMPPTGNEIPPEIAAGDAALEGATIDSIGAGTPTATEQLSGDRLNSLADAVNRAFTVLGGGEVSPPEIPPVEGLVQQAPPELFAAVAAFQAAMQAASTMGVVEARPYADIDVNNLLKTQSGIAELEALLNKASMDERLKRAVASGPAPAAPAPAAPAAPEIPAPAPGDDLDALLA